MSLLTQTAQQGGEADPLLWLKETCRALNGGLPRPATLDVTHPSWTGAACEITMDDSVQAIIGTQTFQLSLREGEILKVSETGLMRSATLDLPDGDITVERYGALVFCKLTPANEEPAVLVFYHATLQRINSGAPESAYAFGGTDTVITTGGVGFGSQARAAGGAKGWG